MKYTIILILLFIFISCTTDKKFDKIQWLEKTDLGQYPKRNSILSDLLINYKAKNDRKI